MNGWLTIKTRLLTGGVKSGLKDIIKSVAQAKGNILEMVRSFTKITLIIGAIVGAFKLLSGGLNSLLEKNEDLTNKIQAIRLAASNLVQGIFTAVGNLLEPAITRIIDLIFRFMAYLNVITKDFFGIDLFAKSTNKSLKGASKSAKEIKKSLAGFDEINKLSDSSSGGGAGGSGGSGDFKMPEIDTALFEAKLQTFKKDWTDILDISIQEAKDAFLGDKGLWGYFKLGLFWIEQGFTKTFNGIIKIFNGEFKEGFKQVLEGLGTILLGVVSTSFGLIRALFIKAVIFIQGITDTMKDMLLSPINELISTLFEAKSKIVNAFKDIANGIKKLFQGDLKGALDSFKSAFSNIMGSLWTIAKGPLNLIISGINALIRGLNKIQIKMPDWAGGKSFGIKIKEIPRLAKGGIVSNPGLGVNMGTYIAGEKGPEAVIPLTDDTLQRLASMIPITIDLTNTIDGRVLNRRLEVIKQNDTFARNGVR